MKQLMWHKKHGILVVAMLCAAMCFGMVWAGLAAQAVQADDGGTFLLQTSYKDASPREVTAGGTISYTIVLRNDNPVSRTKQVTVTDVLDDRLHYTGVWQVLPSGGYLDSATGGVLRFVVLLIEPQTSITLTFQTVLTTTAQPGAVITNTALVSDGVGSLPLSVAVTVAELPTVQIDSPWDQQYFTQREPVVVRGRVWVGSMPDGFPLAPRLLPISNGNGAYNTYTVQWESVPDAQYYILQESETINFAAISNEQTLTTVSYLYSNKTRNQTYYYRVKAFTGDYESRWSNVQSVTVNPAQVAGALTAPATQAAQSPQAAPLVDVIVTRVGGGAVPQTYAATVVPDPFGDAWWNWAYTWTLPVENDVTMYTLQARGKDALGTYDLAKSDMITVTIKNGICHIYLPLVMRRYPPVPYAPTLKLDSDDTYGTYQLSWTYTGKFAPTSYRFQEATDANFTNLTGNDVVAAGANLKAYTEKAAGAYYYRVRGINSYGEGEWSNVISVLANPRVPFAPTLKVDSDNAHGTYQLSWSYNHTLFPPTQYRFQEATNAGFTTPTVNEVIAAGANIKAYTGKAAGTYYYRVSGINTAGEGAWSNVVTITVTSSGYFDDFSNNQSGWYRGTLQESGRNVFSALYFGGTYRLKVMLDKNSLNNYRMGIIPAPYVHPDASYDVEVDHIFKSADDQVVDPIGGKAGVVFRADYHKDGYFPAIYVVEWNFEGQCAVYKYSKIGSPLTDIRQNVITWEQLLGWQSGCVPAGYDKNLHVKVEVRGSNTTIYLGSKNIGTFSGIAGENRVGLITGSWERTPVESAFDNFRVTDK